MAIRIVFFCIRECIVHDSLELCDSALTETLLYSPGGTEFSAMVLSLWSLLQYLVTSRVCICV